MRPLTRTISALLVASIATTAAAPAFADPGHGRGWDRSDRDRHDRDRHDRDRHDRYERGRTVYVYRDNDRYRRNYYYGDPYRHHRHKKDNDGEVALGISAGRARAGGVSPPQSRTATARFATFPMTIPTTEPA